MITILVPAYNEEGSIANVVRGFSKYGPVVVCDNSSTDRTADEARNAGAKVITAPKGKGNAVRELLKEESDIYAFIDGDDAFNPHDLNKVLDLIRRGKADMVIGKRLNIDVHNRNSPLLRRFFLKMLRFIFHKRFHDHDKIYDFMSGMRAFNHKVKERLSLKSEGFGIETEMTIQALKNKFIVREVEVLVKKRQHGTQKSNILNVGLPVLRQVLFG